MLPPSPLATPDQASGAVDYISQMLTGAKVLQDQPGVVYALAKSQASPADAQTVDQFMQGLEAEKQVRIASAAGTHISLTSQQQRLLDNMGVDYSGVQYNYASAVHDAAASFEAQTGATVKRDAMGNPILSDAGQFQIQQPHHHRSGLSALWHGFTSDVVGPVYRDVLKPIGNVASKGYNFVSTQASDWFHQNTAGLNGGAEGEIHADVSRNADMQAQGYDPTNFWSRMAFDSSGKAHSDLTPLSNKWDSENPNGLYGWDGSTAVAEASKFLDNPKAYEKAIENDPSLTPDQVAAKLKVLSTPQFQTLARQVSAKSATPGNDFANLLGIDPAKHATTYALTSAGLNLAAAFVVDPLMLAGGVYKGVRLSQVGMDTLGDSAKAAKILDPEVSKGVFAQRLQARVQNFLDLTHQMGEAEAAGDTVKASSLSARIAAQHKELAPLVPDVLGKNAIKGFDESGPVLGETEPIRTLGDFANYIAGKAALTRLMGSRAAVQSSLMPGAVSNFGLRLLQGKMAGWMTARSAARSELHYAAVVNAAEADPALASKLVHEGILTRLQPEADDAARLSDGTVIADKTAAEEPGLASEARGQFAVTPAGKGDIAFNLRSQGTPLGTRTLGWATPAAIAARSRLAAQRLSTLLPRNTLIDINDAASAEKVYKLAMTYMGRGEANALRAAWNAGDGGTRKSILHGLVDQLGHAAGLGKSESGQAVLDGLKTKVESYSSVGDEVTLDGDNIALHPGQVRTTWLLPTFRELQQASAKVGLWESTLGRALTSTQADTLMSQWKLGALFKPSTITRNQLEGWGRTALEGKAGDAIKAKAFLTTRNKDRWAAGFDDQAVQSYVSARGKVEGLQKMLAGKGLSREQRTNASAQIAEAKSSMADLEKSPRVQHMLALEAGDTKLAKQIENSSMLSGDELGRSAPVQRLADLAPFALAGRAYRALTGRFMDERTVAAMETLGHDDLTESLRGFANQMLDADLGMRRAAREATDVAAAGFGPSILRRNMRHAWEAASDKTKTPAEGQVVSWTQHDTDGINGATRYANALAQRVNPTPNVARAVLDRIEDPENHTIDHVVQALDDPAIRKQMQLTGWGKVFWEDPSGPALRATTPAEVLIGKQEWAQKIVNDYAYLLTGQDGEYSQDVADYIREAGKAPDAPWIADNLEGMKRPAAVLAPDIEAMPNGGKQGLISALMDVEGEGYKWMVERVLQRTTSSPVFLANYAQARAGLEPVVGHMIEQGVSPEAAAALAKELSIRNAWIKTEQLIDDPGQKSQFDIVARNIFPFSRATQAMIRRWGGGIWQDPIKAQKMMLAYEGAVHSGFIYTNSYGEPTFVYPGSGVMNLALRELAKVPGFQSLAHFPVSASMTGGVLMSVPGADNPFRMSAGPMVMIPLREVSKLLPGHDRLIFDEIDSALNGPVGQGQTFGTLVPTAARRFYQAMSTDDRNSAMASSMIGAIANLAAAGRLPAQDATPAQRQEFLNHVRSQVRSQLFLRAAFGLFAPASPSQPSEGTDASASDYAFNVRGIGQLSDEYKQILNDVGGDLARANAIWTALHPDDTVYEVGHSQATTSKVSLPATTKALEWMNTHSDFVHKYGSVAAYFLPESAGNEPFNDQAYKTQIELGLRQRKTPDEFMNDVYVRHAESIFYPSVAEFDARITAAKNAGDTNTASMWTQAKSAWEAQFKALNPMFQKKIDSYGDARAQALGQLQNLRQMLQDGDVPDGQAPILRQLIGAYDGFEKFANENKGSDQASKDLRSAAQAMFDQWVQQNIAGGPLADLYSGVFRVLDTNFVNISNPTTGSGP